MKRFPAAVAALLAFLTQSFAQINVTSPTATEFVRYERVPVSYFNGLPKVEVPLYTVDYDDIHFPISLSYHASGIKVNQYPTPVRLGRTRNSGGAIVRVINGMPDEYSAGDVRDKTGLSGNLDPGYYFLSSILDTDEWMSEPGKAEYRKFYESDCDFEPDEFVINAYGVSGSVFFYRNAAGNIKSRIKSNNGESFRVLPPVLKEYRTSDSGIKFASSTAGYSLNAYRIHKLFYEFTVIKQDGTQLVFGGKNDCIEFYTEKINGSNGPFLKTWPSAWMLRKVVSTKGNTIVFDYLRDGSPLIMSDVRTDVSVYSTGGNAVFPSHHPDRGRSFIVQHPLYPNSISVGDKFKINFSSSRNGDMPTVNEQDREYLKLTGFNDALINKDGVCFENGSTINKDYSPHNYFRHLARISVEYGETWLKSYYFSVAENNGERLKLSKLYIRDESGYNEQSYAFHYDQRKLPVYNSTETDNWGYWNNKNYRNTSVNRNFFDYRSPSLGYAKAESLSGITYPTGGTVSFEYELNDYSKVATQIPDFEIQSRSGQAGGLRIRQITYGTDSTSYIHRFEYKNEDGTSSGILSGIPRYIAEGSEHTEIKYSGWDGLVYFRIQDDIEQRYKMVSESYINNLGLTTGNHVTYSRVKEYVGESSPLTKEYRYTNHDTRPDTSDYAMYTNIDNVALDNKFTSRASERGLLTDEIWYDDGCKVKEINYIYNSNPARFDDFVKSVDRFKVSGANLQYNLPFVRFAPYKILTYYPYLEGRTEKMYSPDGQTEMSKTTEVYAYNGNLQPVKKVSYSPGYGHRTTTITYPDDSYGTVFSDMVSKGMVSVPVERTEFLSGRLIGSIYTGYKSVNGIITPDRQWKLQLKEAADSSSFVRSRTGGCPADSRYKLDMEVLRFDDHANPLVVRCSDGITTSYMWDKDRPLYIAHYSENADVPEDSIFFYENFEKGGLDVYPFGYCSGHCATSPVVARVEGGSSESYHLDYRVYKKGKWEYVRKELSTPEYLIDEGRCPIDEVRMWPAGSEIETYNWIPFIGLRSRTGADGVTESYGYDYSGRLRVVMNNDGDIVKEYKYNCISQSRERQIPIYYNSKISMYFENGNCDRKHGFVPIPILYTVPAYSFSSTESVEEANRMAFDHMVATGQQYADEHGECRALANVVSVSVYNITGEGCRIEFVWSDYEHHTYPNMSYVIPPSVKTGASGSVADIYIPKKLYLDKRIYLMVSVTGSQGNPMKLTASSGFEEYFPYTKNDIQDTYIITKNN